MVELIDKTKIVAFTGNRNIIPPRGVQQCDIEGDIRALLASVLEQLYLDGKSIFLSGGAMGFDLVAAEEVLKLKVLHSDVKLIFVVPFIGQEAKFPASEQQRYRSLCALADEVVVIDNEGYSLRLYHIRNDYMLKHCSHLVAYNGNRSGGAASTLRRAKRLGITTTNLFDILSLEGLPTQQQLPF